MDHPRLFRYHQDAFSRLRVTARVSIVDDAAHCSLLTTDTTLTLRHPVTQGDLQGRLGLTTMLTPSSTCHQSGFGPTSMIGAGSPTPSLWLCYHHQHQISRYTHLWSVMCYPDPVPTLQRLAEAGSACIQCMLFHAQMSDDWLPAPSPASPNHVQDYHYHNISPDLRDDPFNHLSPFLLIVSWCGNWSF